MTAARSPSERRAPGAGAGRGTRLLAGVLCGLVAWTPWALTWGDAFADAARAGQQAGEGGRGAIALPATAGSNVVLPSAAGGSLSFGALFPGSTSGSPAEFSALYGNHTGTLIQGQAAQSALVSEDSPTGEAYRTLRAAVDRTRPDSRLDPLWAQTDDVLENFGAIARTFADCQTVTTFQNTTRQTHVADDRTCDRVVAQGGACSWYHDYRLPDPKPLGVTVSGMAEMSSCGATCMRVTLGWEGDAWASYGVFRGAFPVTGAIAIDEPARVTTISASLTFGDPQPPALPEGYEPWSETIDYRAIIGSRDIAAFASPPPTLVNEDVTDALRHGGLLYLAAVKSVWAQQTYNDGCAGCDFSILMATQPSRRLTIDIHYQPLSAPLSSVWGSNDACYDILNLGNSNFCEQTIQCLGSPPLAPSGCYEAPGVEVCPEMMSPPPIAGQNRFCTEIKVSADCSGFNRGQMACWIDPQGQLQCPFNAGDQPSDCPALEQDPGCGFIKSACVEGATDNRGVCFLFEETWDCGTLKSIPALDRLQTIDCAGPVRCMGSDCAAFASEQSGDFSKAVAALQSVQMAVSDMQCSSGGQCRVFSGQAHECKRAVGGIVNCCTTPEGISLGNYLDLVFAVSKIDNALMGLDRGSAIRGAWETLREPVTSTWSAVKESFTSVANNLMGNTAASATDSAAQLATRTFTQELMVQTAEWAAQLFGDAAVNALFSTTTGAAAVSGGAVADGAVLQLGGGAAWLGTAMVVVMYVYIIYTVVMILIKLIWTCEQEEFELGAKRELRACHRVGSYCKKDVLSWCVEKRESYCCFNTPLARIMNEQIRPQLGRDWGEAEAPECFGINVADLARVDWNRVNLDEWLAILYETGHFPTMETLTIDDLTGAGSDLSIHGGRANAADRSIQRSDGLDSEQLRMDGEDELWGETLPALPAE